MDLTKLKNEYTFATNYFMLHERFEDLGIKYYCMSDPQMWNHGNGFSETLYQKLNARKDMVKFFGHGAKKTCEKLGLFKDNEPYYVFVNCARLVRDGFFMRDVTRYTNWGNTVIIDFCLPLAQYMGFTQIYLLGCDCDYGQGASGGSSYFYPVSDSRRSDAVDDLMINRWPDWVFRSYRVVRDALEPDGINIFNAGYGGRLEVFERVDYDSIV